MSSLTRELIAFVLARVAEDEANINARTKHLAPAGSDLLEQFGDFGDDERWMIEISAGRLRAQCAAIRKIAEKVQSYLDLAERYREYAREGVVSNLEVAHQFDGYAVVLEKGALWPIASIWVDHPDFQERWRA